MPSTVSPCRLVPYTPPRYPLARMLCRLTKPNLPGCVEAPVTSTPSRLEQRTELRVGGPRPADGATGAAVAELDERVDRDGRAVGAHDQRVDVDARDVGPGHRRSRQPEEHRLQLLPVDGGLAAELARAAAAWPARRSSRRRRRRRSAPAGTPRRRSPRPARRRRRASRSARTAGRAPRRRSARGCRLTIGATSTLTAPSSGVAAASRSAAAASTAAASPSRSRTRPRSVLWAMASPHSLTTTGKPIAVGGGGGLGGGGDLALVGHRHAELAQQRLRRRFRQGGAGCSHRCPR